MNHPDDHDPDIDATGPGGIFEPSLGSTSVPKPPGDLNPGAVAAFTPWEPLGGNMMVMYGLPPDPTSPRDLDPLGPVRPWVPVPPFQPADQTAPVPAPTPNAPAGGSKPSPSSVVVAITYVRQHFNLVLPPQDSRIQALASLLDLAADVGSAR